MKCEMIPTIQAVAEYMPPKKNGFFEKSMEVAKLLLEHEPVNALCSVINQGIQTIGMIRETKYRADTFKYAAHLEEVRTQAMVEMAKIQYSQGINLYIDRAFQRSLDAMESEYLMQSRRLNDYGRRMIGEIDKRVDVAYKGIDLRYVNTIKENEMKCAAYRDYTDRSVKEGVRKTDVALYLIKKMADNMNRYDSRAISDICGVLQEMMRTNPISFEEYIVLSDVIKKKGLK